MNAISPLQPSCRRATLNRGRRIAAFTLLELMVGVAIAGILAALAAPSFSNLVANQRSKAVATDLYVALSKARSEAIKRNTSVTLSPKTANVWKDGWEIIDPSDANKKIEDHAAITGGTITVPDGVTSVTYRSSGRVQGNTTPTFDITVSGTDSHVCVTVNLSGLPSQKSSSC